MPQKEELSPGGKKNFLGLLSILQAGVSSSAPNLGEIRMEFGGQYTALQIGPAFGSNIVVLRTAIMGHVAFQPWPRYPFLIYPTLTLGYSFAWVNDKVNTHLQDVYIVPGARLTYRVLPRLALVFDPIQIQISFLRFRSDDTSNDISRDNHVPVSWNLAFGVHFLY